MDYNNRYLKPLHQNIFLTFIKWLVILVILASILAGGVLLTGSVAGAIPGIFIIVVFSIILIIWFIGTLISPFIFASYIINLSPSKREEFGAMKSVLYFSKSMFISWEYLIRIIINY